QLHPHFLFNTLNAISMLVRKGEGDTAVRMIAGLSDLLRLALATAGQQEVPLRQELDFLERYLCLQQIRFPDRLQIQMRIDPDTPEARVPSLVLQPLAENAVRHGIAPSIAGGSVEVAAMREGEQLVLRVRDTGVGLGPNSESPGGVGLRNVRARLQHLYPGQHRFRVVNRVEGGVESLLAIPFRGAEVVRAGASDGRGGGRRAARPGGSADAPGRGSGSEGGGRGGKRGRGGGAARAHPSAALLPRRADAGRKRVRGAGPRRGAAPDGGLRDRVRPVRARGVPGARLRLPAQAVRGLAVP